MKVKEHKNFERMSQKQKVKQREQISEKPGRRPFSKRIEKKEAEKRLWRMKRWNREILDKIVKTRTPDEEGTVRKRKGRIKKDWLFTKLRGTQWGLNSPLHWLQDTLTNSYLTVWCKNKREERSRK